MPGELPADFLIRYAGVRSRRDSPSRAELEAAGWSAVHESRAYPGTFYMVRATPRVGRGGVLALFIAVILLGLLAGAVAGWVTMEADSRRDFIGAEATE